MVNGYAVTAKPVPLSVNLMNCKERYILDYQLIRTNNHILISRIQLWISLLL